MGFSEMTDILGWEWIDFDEQGSTNDKARELTAEPPAKRFDGDGRNPEQGQGAPRPQLGRLEGKLVFDLCSPVRYKIVGTVCLRHIFKFATDD